MALDQVENFVEVSVDGTHTDTDTTIQLGTGEASELPDPTNGEYNLVWFDSTNFVKPSDDPEVEIVRVTARDTGADTITVQRGQENTTATAKDTAGANYIMLLSNTAKMIEDIGAELIDNTLISPAAGQTLLYDSANSEFVNGFISAGTSLTSTSGDGSFTLNVDETTIDHDNLTNFVSNEHIDHTTVNINSGTNLSGGGDITASRTIDMATSWSTAVGPSDDTSFQFGSGTDFSMQFDSANTRFELTDDGVGDIFRVDAGTQILDIVSDINFPNVTGTPTFTSHDHSEGGLNPVQAVGSNVVGTSELDEGAGFQFTTAIGLNDDTDLDLGTNDDAAIRFDAANDRLEIVDQGVPEDVIRIPMNGTGDIEIPNRNLDLGTNNITNVGTYEGVTNDVDIGGQTNVTAASSDEVLIEDASDAGNKKKVTAQSIADLGGGGNVPNWQEDGNSPINVSNVSSQTYTLASSYDQVMVIIQDINGDGASGDVVQLQVNGDTGANYDFTEEDAVETTGANQFRLFFAEVDNPVSGSFKLTKTRNNIALFPQIGQGEASFTTATGVNENVSPPINQFTFLTNNNRDITIKARVFGWNGGL